MSASLCCSLIRPSPLVHKPYPSWPLLKLNHRQIWSLTLRNDARASARAVVRAMADGVGVASPDDVSFEEPALIETEEEGNGEVEGVVDGVAESKPEDKALRPATMYKKKEEDEESLEDRFKLRNGKEIFEEKAYIVGVEQKRSSKDLFGVEESLKELSQLADTTGLMVVG